MKISSLASCLSKARHHVIVRTVFIENFPFYNFQKIKCHDEMKITDGYNLMREDYAKI